MAPRGGRSVVVNSVLGATPLQRPVSAPERRRVNTAWHGSTLRMVAAKPELLPTTHYSEAVKSLLAAVIAIYSTVFDNKVVVFVMLLRSRMRNFMNWKNKIHELYTYFEIPTNFIIFYCFNLLLFFTFYVLLCTKINSQRSANISLCQVNWDKTTPWAIKRATFSIITLTFLGRFLYFYASTSPWRQSNEWGGVYGVKGFWKRKVLSFEWKE